MLLRMFHFFFILGILLHLEILVTFATCTLAIPAVLVIIPNSIGRRASRPTSSRGSWTTASPAAEPSPSA